MPGRGRPNDSGRGSTNDDGRGMRGVVIAEMGDMGSRAPSAVVGAVVGEHPRLVCPWTDELTVLIDGGGVGEADIAVWMGVRCGRAELRGAGSGEVDTEGVGRCAGSVSRESSSGESMSIGLPTGLSVKEGEE